MVVVSVLADRPDLARAVGKACFDEWPDVAIADFGIGSADEFTDDLLRRGKLVLVAHSPAGEFVGTVTLHPGDMPNHRPELTPWMACLFVVPEHRRKGVGGLLVRCVHLAAHAQGVPRVFLWAESNASCVGLYKRHGWTVRETIYYHPAGGPVVIMELDTTKCGTSGL